MRLCGQCEAYLEKLAAAIADLQASGDGVAAMIVCSILANEGLPDIPAGFMAPASYQCCATSVWPLAHCRPGSGRLRPQRALVGL